MKKSSQLVVARATLLLNTVYLNCIAQKPFKLADVTKECQVSSNYATVLLSKFIRKVRYLGITEGSLYEWINDPPNDELTNLLVNELRENNKKVRDEMAQRIEAYNSTHLATQLSIPEAVTSEETVPSPADELKQTNPQRFDLLFEMLKDIKGKTDFLYNQFS